MSNRLTLRIALFAICTGLLCGFSVQADEREEIKLRIQEIRKQAAQLIQEGLRDKAAGLIREQEELMQRLNSMNSQGRFQGRGPSPEQMEKFEQAMQRVRHLRIASENLKQAEMHDMAADLMRRAEDIEQDLRKAKENLAEQMRNAQEPQRDQPQRDQAQRDQRRREQPQREQPQREQARGDQPNRPNPESRGPEARLNGLERQIEQIRAENRELRMMVEKLANGLRRSGN